MTQKIDITSSVLEKGVDVAKDFLDKLIMPAIEETGLLIKDHVTLWKFKNQVRMLNKAKDYCEKNNISFKTISLKLLCPLLDYSGIEEDEILQNKWAILLSNMVDSEQNIENHVFPYMLSQLSTNEFLVLEKVYDEKQIRVVKLTLALNKHRAEKPDLEKNLKINIEELEKKITAKKDEGSSMYGDELWGLRKTKNTFENQLKSLQNNEWTIIYQIRKSEIVPEEPLKDFELSNLIRLGLVKEEKEFYANSQTLEIPNDRDDWNSHIRVDLDIDVDSNTENILTELGELFINACKEKKEKNIR